MYRYSADNAITYTSEDFVLFRESPFANWMERLTLENPDHAIPPDLDGEPPNNSMQRQDDVADTLRAEGKHVRLIDWDADESQRRNQTLDAMREGVDFVVNGQLALGPLSGSANLLMRTSGYSELGDYLYIPCDTQVKTTLHSAFRLCFLADLLHSLQGQLPPQLLIIRSGDDLVPLQTEDHIYHYRAVKQRFMAAMRDFRKHRMPDPAESSHFGRWSDCAHEVLKQRMLREEEQPESTAEEASATQEVLVGLQQAVGADLQPDTSAYDLDDIKSGELLGQAGGAAPSSAINERQALMARPYMGSAPVGPTLAEQARMINPDSYRPGPGNPRFRSEVDAAAAAAAATDVAETAAAATAAAEADVAATAAAATAAAATAAAEADVAETAVEPISVEPINAELTEAPSPVIVPRTDAAPVTARPGQDRRGQDRIKPVPVGFVAPDGEAENHEQSVLEQSEYRRRASDEALENLEFIGSSRQPPQIGNNAAQATRDEPFPLSTTAPSPSLRDPRAHRTSSSRPKTSLTPPPAPSLGQFYGADEAFERGTEVTVDEPNPSLSLPEAINPPEIALSGVDRDELDSAIPTSPPPVLPTGKPVYEDLTDKNLRKPAFGNFSDSLITSEDYDI